MVADYYQEDAGRVSRQLSPPSAVGRPADIHADLLARDPASSLPALELVLAANEPQRFDLLVSALVARNPLVGAHAAEALEAYGEAAIAPLLQAVDTAHILVKLRIIKALDVIGNPRAVTPLLALLNATEHIPLRYTIIEALGNLAIPSVADVLQPYLTDEDHHVREKTQAALKKLIA